MVTARIMPGARIRVSVEGVSQLVKNIDQLKDSVRKRIFRRAVGGGTRIILNAVKGKLTRRRTGQLRKSLGRKTKTYRSGTVVGIVGPRKGFKARVTFFTGGDAGRERTIIVDPVNYAHLVEFGTAPHVIPIISENGSVRYVKHPGAKAYPFMRPGLDASAQAVLQKMVEIVREDLVREAKKLGGKR